MTVAVVLLAVFNFEQEQSFQQPTDGVWWVEAQGALQAQRVPANSAGERAGIKPGDLLLSVNRQPTPRIAALVREQFRTKIYGTAGYAISRLGIHVDVPVILDNTDTTVHSGLRLIALVYLGIGLYVLFRRWTAPHATHFYIFCLLSFVMYAFWYTGKLNAFDRTIYWFWIVAGALQPALFLHFALSFTGRSQRRRVLLLSLCYAPAALVIGLQLYAELRWQATELLAHRLDQTAMAYLDAFYLLATLLFAVQYRRARANAPEVLERQQLKWLARGSLLSVLPFSLFYVLPYLLDWSPPELLRDLTIVSLVILPLTFAWAIVRYRLMYV